MLRGMRRGRIGRWLCRHGLHKWTHASAVDRLDSEPGTTMIRITSYAWCADDTCSEPTRITNSETRTFVHPE